ncbi:MAG: DUF4114 domain-containing protein [Synechococcales cyanobacterium RM1_1_8]|nr:DUF4114 domain-containing protein [Synechococcales cyanobacterium RM1_1_8]
MLCPPPLPPLPPPPLQLNENLWKAFNTNYVQNESVFVNNANSLSVDLSKLTFAKGANSLDVFFINEGAGYRNQLTFSGGSYNNQMIFDDISSKDSVVKESNGKLKLGQGFSFTGGLKAGDAVDFTLISNKRSNYTFGTNMATNVDGLQHAIGYEYFDGTDNWLILGFEDLYGDLKAQGTDSKTGLKNEGSDRDFNDVVVALRGVSTREFSSQAVPEPGMMLGLAGAAAVGVLRRRQVAKV